MIHAKKRNQAGQGWGWEAMLDGAVDDGLSEETSLKHKSE